MRKATILFLLLCLTAVTTLAQSAADRIVGTYAADFASNEVKVKAFRYQDGYRLQICWLKKTHNDDGTLKLDTKNPDAAKRTTPMSKVVLVEKVVYRDGIWQDGRIYDPKHGRTYKVELKLQDKTLEVKGKVGPFHKCFYWKKIQ